MGLPPCFFGTVYITLKLQNSKSFQRNICTDYRRKTGASIVYISYFVEAESHAVTLHRHTIRGADLFDVSLHDDVAELLVQLHGIADAIRLLTGNQCAAGTAEGVQNHSVAHGGVHDRICQKRNRLHGRVIAVLLGLVKLPYGGFLTARVPLVLAVFLPAIEHRLMLHWYGERPSTSDCFFQMQQPER